jgi:hypothetical protein
MGVIRSQGLAGEGANYVCSHILRLFTFISPNLL